MKGKRPCQTRKRGKCRRPSSRCDVASQRRRRMGFLGVDTTPRRAAQQRRCERATAAATHAVRAASSSDDRADVIAVLAPRTGSMQGRADASGPWGTAAGVPSGPIHPSRLVPVRTYRPRSFNSEQHMSANSFVVRVRARGLVMLTPVLLLASACSDGITAPRVAEPKARARFETTVCGRLGPDDQPEVVPMPAEGGCPDGFDSWPWT